MRLTKRLAGALGLVVVIVMLLTIPVVAQSTAQVTATVTPMLVAVSVDTGAVDYGVVDLNSTASPTGDPTIQATNDGNVNEDFDILGADAVATVGGETDWTLASAPGPNTYSHRFATGAFSSYGNLDKGANYVPMAAGVASAGSEGFKLQIDTPSLSTGMGQRTTTVTVRATASTP